MTLDRMVFQFPRSSRECTRAVGSLGHKLVSSELRNPPPILSVIQLTWLTNPNP